MWADRPLPAGSASLTAEEAQARQNEALEKSAHLTWFVGFVTDADGAVMARAHTADFKGGMLLPGGLVAATLDELRQMLPVELTQDNRNAWDPAEVIEVWWG